MFLNCNPRQYFNQQAIVLHIHLPLYEMEVWSTSNMYWTGHSDHSSQSDLGSSLQHPVEESRSEYSSQPHIKVDMYLCPHASNLPSHLCLQMHVACEGCSSIIVGRLTRRGSPSNWLFLVFNPRDPTNWARSPCHIRKWHGRMFDEFIVAAKMKYNSLLCRLTFIKR